MSRLKAKAKKILNGLYFSHLNSSSFMRHNSYNLIFTLFNNARNLTFLKK